jgi:type IV pilus assembly protein PilX
MAHFESVLTEKTAPNAAIFVARGRERGYVMVISMLIILLITIMSISMAKSFFLEEGMAGNLREKSRSFASAQAGLRYGEWFALLNGGSGAVNCLATAVLASGTICTNAPSALATPGTSTPMPAYWTIPVAPTALSVNVTTSAAQDTFYDNPHVYIWNEGPTSGHGFLYAVRAVGYGGTSNSVSVVQSTLSVHCNTGNLMARQAPC